MEFGEVIRRRRMVRNYLPDPVAPEIITSVVEAGLRAPSAGNAQGQRFVIVTDPDRRHAIANLANEPDHLQRGFDPWLSVAPVHVVVCTSEHAYRSRYALPDKGGSDRNWTVPYWWVDAGASMMAILLAAVDTGLAAGFLGAHAIPGLGRALGIPDEVVPIGLITLGYPAPDRRSGSLALGRRPTSSTVHWERWNAEPVAESEACNTNASDGTSPSRS